MGANMPNSLTISSLAARMFSTCNSQHREFSLFPQLNHLIRNLGKCHIVADEEQLVVPVLGYLFAAYVNGAEGSGKILTAGSI